MIEIFARSDAMREAVRLAERVATTDTNVLITGDSGVGKDVLALFIHSRSTRVARPLIKIDCSTLPGDLLEAELFGYERGAFTGAIESKPGRLEGAQQGTVLLDEIAHLSIDAQAKLLRVIDAREFERLGGRKTIKLDTRFIALTNVDLAEAVGRGGFREDLFYRLNVVQIKVPALVDRGEDLRNLVHYFLGKYSEKHGRDVTKISSAAMSLLSNYDFPGNARELSNILERAVIMAPGKRLEVTDLPLGVTAAVEIRNRKVNPSSLAEVEARYIAEILASSRGNKTECARILGISRKNLYEKIARYKI